MITRIDPSGKRKDFNKTIENSVNETFGFNNKTILRTLPDFDVTKQIPKDVMYTIAEGVLKYETSLVLLHFIQLTLEQINGVKESHNYGYTETSDKTPSAQSPQRNSFFY